MRPRVALIPGTWGRRHDPWWRPGSPFVLALELHGGDLATHEDFYTWSTGLDGIDSANDDWDAAAAALRWWLKAYPADVLIGHSHALQIMALAASHPAFVVHQATAQPPVSTVISVAGPVRRDLLTAYQTLSHQVEHVVQLRSDRDWWQALGTFQLGPHWWRVTRDLPGADVIEIAPGVSHDGLLSPALWGARGWWQFVR